MENRIRALRKSLGLSQEELEKGCGLPSNHQCH